MCIKHLNLEVLGLRNISHLLYLLCCQLDHYLTPVGKHTHLEGVGNSFPTQHTFRVFC